jgi:A/G-specific adenine glycosylase
VTTSGADVTTLVTAALRRRLDALPVLRDFPWRSTRDPWRILVAEVCCQQTQASRAVEAFERVCSRFAAPSDLAAASLAEILDAWRGLGYYRRAKSLHEAARQIVERHDGQVPDNLESLLALPGVGPYTARAVLAFAFERDVGVVDTNVGRVLSRAIANRPLSASDAQRLADSLVGTGRGWAHNQALLDLGALHCAAAPRCEGCALRPSCRWRRSGSLAVDPARKSAGVSRPQARFAGSDREGRGRLLAAALDGPVPLRDLASVAGWESDPVRAGRVATALCEEGLLQRRGGALSIARSPTRRRTAGDAESRRT